MPSPPIGPRDIIPQSIGTSVSVSIPPALFVAVDTEYQGVMTLTVQAALRLDAETLAVQVYRNPATPPPPSDFDVSRFFPTDLKHYGRFFSQVIFRPIREITPDLSPAWMVCDLLSMPDMTACSRLEGAGRCNESLSPPFPNAVANREKYSWRAPEVTLTLINHFQRADFARMFGREFIESLKIWSSTCRAIGMG